MSRDEHFIWSTRIERPASEVFQWHERPGAFERLSPPWEKVEVVSATGGIRDGARVTVRSKVGPCWMTWEMEHRDYVAGQQFRDVQLRGPFARWEHLHRITAEGDRACVLTDQIVYRLPAGGLGHALGRGLVRRKLERMFRWRHAITQQDLESTPAAAPARPLRILLAGASGLIGQALLPYLQTQGHTVIRLVRRAPRGPHEVNWDPENGDLAMEPVGSIDAVVNLSGENVAGGRWTETRRNKIMRSRTDATRTLVSAFARWPQKPAVLVNASAIGFYGDRVDEAVTERSSIGHGFLPEVCLAWETHAEGASRLGVRTALLRFGVVLSWRGGALAKLLPVLRAGVGGRLGDGEQWMSWIALDDVLGAIHFALVNPACEGPINITASSPVTNREFTRQVAALLHRPAVLPVPRFVLRAAFGEMADETILMSTRALPERLMAFGYRFRQPELSGALRHLLGLASPAA